MRDGSDALRDLEVCLSSITRDGQTQTDVYSFHCIKHRKAEAKLQQAELQRKIDRIKGRGDARVKSEAKHAWDISFNSGEVIDLTGD